MTQKPPSRRRMKTESSVGLLVPADKANLVISVDSLSLAPTVRATAKLERTGLSVAPVQGFGEFFFFLSYVHDVNMY